jgi:diguanylate cyclase (GGDEF)-like protein/PAS domain S-box-containing protein
MVYHILPYLSLTAALVFVTLGIYTLHQDPSSRPNRLLFSLSLSLGIWAFGYAFVYHAETPESLWFWFRFSSLGWCMVGGICLHFLMLLTRRNDILERPWIHIALYFPGALLFVRSLTGTITATDFFYTHLGWVEITNPTNPWFWIHTANLFACVLIGVWLTWSWGHRSPRRREKIQSTIIIVSLLSSLLVGSYFNIFLPALQIRSIPAVAQIACLFLGTGLWIAVVKFRMLSLSPDIATQEIIDRMRDILVLINPEGKISQINPQTEELLGYPGSELIGRPFHCILSDPSLAGKIDGMLISQGLSLPNTQTVFRSSTHTLIPVNCSISGVTDPLGDFMGIVMVAQDIRLIQRLEKEIRVRQEAEEELQAAYQQMEALVEKRTAELTRTNQSLIMEIAERKRSENAIRDSELRYRTLVEMSQELILVLQKPGIVDANPAAADFFECPLNQIKGKSVFDLFAEFQPNGQRSVEYGTEMVRRAIQDKPQRFEWAYDSPNRGRIYFDVNLSRFYMGNISTLMIVGRDITEQKQTEQLLRDLSLLDGMTGLNNRRGFFRLAEQTLKMAERQKIPLFLMFLDLDDLKQINDTLGHPAGDNVLRRLADLLKSTFRDSDILARHGGDEFVVLGMETGHFDADTLIEKLQKNLNAENSKLEPAWRISVSIGISRFDPMNPVSLDQLLEQADARMYENKRGRKLQHCG